MAAIAQHNANAGGATTIKYASAQTAGNFNVVGICYATAATLTGISDSVNGAYTLAGSHTTTSLITNVKLSIYYVSNIAAASANSNTVTEAGVAAASVFDLWAVEVSGMGTTVSVDTTASGDGTAGPMSFNITPSFADFIFAIVGSSAGSTGTLTNLTLLDNLNDLDYYKITTTSGAITCSDAGITRWGVFAAAFGLPLTETGFTGNIFLTGTQPNIAGFIPQLTGLLSLNAVSSPALGYSGQSGLLSFSGFVNITLSGAYNPITVPSTAYYVILDMAGAYIAVYLQALIDYGPNGQNLAQSVISGPYVSYQSASLANTMFLASLP